MLSQISFNAPIVIRVSSSEIYNVCHMTSQRKPKRSRSSIAVYVFSYEAQGIRSMLTLGLMAWSRWSRGKSF